MEMYKTFIIYFLCSINVSFCLKSDCPPKRKLPKWYDDAKFGIFLHWGVYSVPSFGSEWFWNKWKTEEKQYVKFMKDNYPPNFTYQDFAADFKAEFFEPTEWAKLFKNSGAKYVVLTTKHHEGYHLWPSKYAFSWNSMDVGPHRDLVGELAKAVRKESLVFGAYHSLFEWYNPLFLEDRKSNFTTKKFVIQKVIPELKELVETYKPELIWSDGDGKASAKYWTSSDFLTWLYNQSSVKDTVVVNNRWGASKCKLGDYFNGHDRFDPGVLQKGKWENAMTIDKHSWGYRRNIKLQDLLSIEELLKLMVRTVSCGGNILMNIGPTSEGTISPIFQERLLQIGKWLSINGDSIYGSSPWEHQNDTISDTVWYTKKEANVYAIILSWPKNNSIELGAVYDLFKKDTPKINLLGTKVELEWKLKDQCVEIQMPDKAITSNDWAWVMKIPVKSLDEENSINVLNV